MLMAIFFRQQMIQNVEYAKVHVNSELKVNMTTKKCTNAWTFTITSKVSVELVQKGTRAAFNRASALERMPTEQLKMLSKVCLHMLHLTHLCNHYHCVLY